MSKSADEVIGIIAFVALFGWGVHSCTASKPTEQAKVAAITGASAEPSTMDAAVAKLDGSRTFDEDSARQAAISALSGETYESSEGGANCTEDCEGHNAGWRWAIDHDLSAGCDPNGESESFDEGCQAYSEAVQRHVDDAEEQFNSGDDTFKKHS